MPRTSAQQDLYEFIADISMTGEICCFRSSLNDSVLFSPGVEQVARAARAYWLIDAIASYLTTTALEPFIKEDSRIGKTSYWRLTVAENCSAVLEARAEVISEPFIIHTIESTDFPLRFVLICAAFDGTYWTLFCPGEF